MSNVFNLICVLLITVGCVILVREYGRHTILRKEFDRLDRSFGALEPSDPSKVLVNCLDDEAPEFFRWRVHIPPMRNCQLFIDTPGSRTRSELDLDSKGSGVFFTLRYRVFDGEARLYLVDPSGSSVITFPKPLRNFIAEYWEQLELEVLGRGGDVEGDPANVWKLFVLKIPARLQPQLPKSAVGLVRDDGCVLEIGFGEARAFPNQVW